MVSFQTDRRRWLALACASALCVALWSPGRALSEDNEKPAADKRFKWSLTERDIVSVSKSRGRIVGVAALGRHGDRLFQVTLHYPEEFAEGFNPRAHRILDEWRWSDTNQGL